MEYYTGPPTQSPETAFQPSASARIFAMGPISEPFYIVPQSTLCDLLRGRNSAIVQDPQQAFYMPHRFDIPQITGDLPLSVQGPFAPSDVFQPLLESFSVPRSDPLADSVPGSTTYASGYGYEATQLSGSTQYLYPTQHWNSPLPSPSPSLPYVAHPGMLSTNTPSAYSPSAAQAYISQMPSHLHPAPDRSVHAHDTPSAARSPASEAPAMTTLRAPACTHCYRSRKKCGWERPCKRCADCGLVCVERERAGRRARDLVAEGLALHDAVPVPAETAVGADISLAEAASSGRLPRTPTAGHAVSSGQE
ncbi:hypothetical protein VTO73DRAFT_10692 [Trametes versicolor]